MFELQMKLWLYEMEDIQDINIDTIVNKIIQQVIIILPNRDIKIIGDYLCVIGGKYLTDGSRSSLKPNKNYRDYIEIYNRCQEYLKWQIMRNLFLSPWHFCVKEYDSGSLNLIQALRQHFFNLSILYIADRTVFVKKIESVTGYQAIFYGENRQVDLALNDPWGRGQLPIVDTSFEDFNKILDFIYKGEITSSEKLKIVQLVIMDHISGIKAADRPAALIEQSGSIYEKIDWQWKIFTGGEIEENWKQIQEFRASIHETVMDFSDQISVLASKLTETVWSGVVVTLGSFLATIFSKDPNIAILKLGLLTYAGYMILFPLIVSMISRWQTYQTTTQLFGSLMKKAQSSLTPAVVKEIIQNSQYERNRKRFIGWFVVSILIYIAIIVLLIVGAFSIPQLIPGE